MGRFFNKNPVAKNSEKDNDQLASEVIETARRIVVVLVCLIGLVLVISLVVRDTESNNSIFARFGQIGDVTGGTVGPILNFCGMLIVYYSLREQLRANAIQTDLLKNEMNGPKAKTQIKEVKAAIKAADKLIEQSTPVLRQWCNISTTIYRQGNRDKGSSLTNEALPEHENRRLEAVQQELVGRTSAMRAKYEIAFKLVKALLKSDNSYVTDFDKSQVLESFHEKCLMPLYDSKIFDVHATYGFRMNHDGAMERFMVSTREFRDIYNEFDTTYSKNIDDQLKKNT